MCGIAEMPESSPTEITPTTSNIQKVRVGLPGGTVHEFELDIEARLSTLVDRIIQAEQLDPNTVRIRLISAGKLFTDHSQLVRDVANQGGFIHAAISEANTRQGADGRERNREIPVVLEAIDVDGEVRIIIPNLTSSRLSRLTQAGLTEEEVRMIRRQLRAMRRELRARERGRDADSSSRQIEDSHGEDQHTVPLHPQIIQPRLGLTSGAEGTNGDFLMGCVFGYLLGILVLVLLLDNGATRRWRVGIIAGIATNCAFGILRTSLLLPGNFTPP